MSVWSSDRESEEFRAIFDNSPIGNAITSLDGVWLQVNRALSAMLGYSVAELLATSFVTLTHTDDLPKAREAVRLLVSGERESVVVEKRFRAHDGSYVWVHVTTQLRRTAEGAPLHFFSYLVDITDRKKSEADLQASETRYRRLFESAKDGILILDAESGRIVDVNPFMAELTGYPRTDFLGKHLWEIGAFKDVAAARASFAELLAREYVRYDDLPLNSHDGQKVEVEFVSNVYLVDGRRVIQCNIRDVTERRRAEADLRLRDRAIQAVTQGIVITDSLREDHPIIYASPGFERLSGYSTAEVLGKNCRFMQGPDTDPDARAKLRESLSRGQACSVEILNVRKDGTTFWNLLALSPVIDAGGRVTNFIGVQTDVTDRRKLEMQFLQAQKMEAVGRLAGGVAHDFNNVLSVILSYAEMIAADLQPDEPLRADVEEIVTAGVRATDLTRQLLAFSRQQVLETRVLDLSQLLAKMEKLLHRLLGADITLTMLPSSGLWNVKADPGRIEQIVMNLAVNARDAMPRGGELTIETGNVDLDDEYASTHHEVRAGAYVMLAVTDSGVGMDQKTQARIFEPFFTTKVVGKGTGLGLATVFGIVKQSGGHIWVYSEPGEGTTFKIYFPRVLGAADAVDARPAESPPAESSRGSETILLVEDDDQVRVIAQNILRRRGYVVLVASNGGEALLACEKHGARIHLLLTDVVLPRMSGRQLAERLTPMRPEMRVLFMSGYTDDAMVQHGVLDSGMAFLEKPLTPMSLARKVRETLDAPRVHA
jgi:two-component system cell cycle sensor histidine kinase/response regulator CckA